MTVLFAFASPKHEAAFIAGDDLEAHRKVSVDKVYLCWRRFAVGVYGLDTLLQAVQYSAYGSQEANRIRYANGAEITVVTDVQALCAQAEQRLPRLAKFYKTNMDRKLSDGSLGKDEYEKWMATVGGLVILDYEACQIHLARLTRPILDGSPARFEIELLEPEQVYRFGINDPTPVACVTAKMVEKPRDWCAAKVLDAKQECGNAGFHGVVGNLGASFAKQDGVTEFWSAFKSVDDYMTANGLPELQKTKGASATRG